MVMVGWMFSERPTTCWPTWLSPGKTPVERLDKRAVVAVRAGFRADAEDSREDCSLEQLSPMVVDLILQARVTLGVGPRLALEHDRAPVGHDEAIPDEEGPRLAEGDLRVVLADEARPLRDLQEFSGRAVVNVLGHLGGDLAGQIGAQAGDQRCGND